MFSVLQAQLASRKQIFDSVELANQSEIHHLTSKLERANDTICANEMEVERLNMRVDDLNDANQKILEEQRIVQDELKISRSSLEVCEQVAWKESNAQWVRNRSGLESC